MIRVLHVITRLVRGGADENTVHTVYGLDPTKYRIDLAYGADSEAGHMISKETANVRHFEIPELQRRINTISDLRALWRLYRIILRNRYHIVHTHTAKAGLLGRIAAFCARTPVIIHSLHGTTFGPFVPFPLRELFVLMERLSAAMTDCIVSVGEDLKERYLSRKIGHSSKYTVIRSGMHLASFAESGEMSESEKAALRESLGLDADALVIGNISRIEPRKGHEYFVKSALSILEQRPSAKFLIVGDGESRPVIDKLVKHLGLSESVFFTGFRRDVARIISIIDIVALTSLWEGLPRVLVQACAVGKPVVCFDVEGASEVIREGENGFIVPARDVDTFASRMVWLLDHRVAAARMGIAGKKMVNEEWNVSTMIARFEELYAQLLCQKKIS